MAEEKQSKELPMPKYVENLHNKMQRQFKIKPADVKLAQDLEKFLNFIVYNKKININNMSNDLEILMDAKLIDSLREDPYILKLFNGQVPGVSKGDAGERAFALSILKILQHTTSNAVQNTEEEVLKILQGEGVIIGKQSATIINKKILEENEKAIKEKIGKQQSIREYTEFDARAGKIDINMGKLEFVIKSDLTPLAKKLKGITASVKNYSDFAIHLEYVDTRKAYEAIMTELYKKYTPTAINTMYNEYYAHKILDSHEIVDAHLNHIMNIYALTGYGQIYITQEELERKYAKFLMYNNTEKKIIKVISTHQIIADNVFKDNGAFSARYSASKKRYETSFNIKRYLTN
jgi:hypothetical protein